MTPISLGAGLALQLGGFVDVGWFDVQGSGTAYVPDYADASSDWRFTGDPWATTINSQGDPADLGATFNPVRPDPVASGGAPTFLVNTVEAAAVVRGPTIDAEVGVWVEPRDRLQVSLDRAYLTWHPGDDRAIAVHAGKIESPFGLEWYRRRAPDRPSITPSLVARYTTGTPLGASVHARVPGGHVDVIGALTNGGTATTRFGHFVETGLDSNGVPTGTARVEVWPAGPAVTFGASGQVGAQDGARDVVPMVQVGGDVALHGRGVYVHAEYLLTDQDQGDRREVDPLWAHGGYLQVWAQPVPWVAPLLRVDRRVGHMEVVVDPGGPLNVYDADVVRLTAGARFDLSPHVAARAEVLHLWELRGAPIADDVVTTSVLAHF